MQYLTLTQVSRIGRLNVYCNHCLMTMNTHRALGASKNLKGPVSQCKVCLDQVLLTTVAAVKAYNPHTSPGLITFHQKSPMFLHFETYCNDLEQPLQPDALMVPGNTCGTNLYSETQRMAMQATQMGSA